MNKFFTLAGLLLCSLLVLGCTQSAPASPTPTLTVPASGVFDTTANDFGFKPDAVSAPAGSKMTLNVLVSKDDTYFGGLQIKCPALNIDSGNLKQGESSAFAITVPAGGAVCTAYWPSNGVKKGDFTIHAT